MKRFGLILAACFVSIGFHDTRADDGGDIARAAVRRASVENVVSSRTTTQSRLGDNVTAATPKRSVPTTRSTNTLVPRTTSTGVAPRTTTTSRAEARGISTRGTEPQSSRIASRTISRASKSDSVTREDVLSRNYSKCKSVFFECMDEFCANKDTQLKRCACSSRINEFDSTKKRLEAVEDKMLDFNQRLLTVSMEKEDAEALSVATEGEEAYLATKDTSASKKTLDAIAKKLKTNFDSSNFDNSSMNALSWSIDMDAAFDTVNSLQGASTTTKTGTALYSAALPICREMAAEVCNDSDVSIAEGGYQALIEQDCNTVAKTYKSQADQARAQVLESSALLDMSRLNIYQQRNSDDILTCKKKMLDMMTNSTVCGTELGKCLDVTGQYIDPSTGTPFLTENLVELGNLLQRPTDGSTWSATTHNATFVTFLKSKKKFLEPAMEQCQDIADDVWDAFIEDALAQIKLAQDAKLENVRQSCTTLTAQCLSDATKSIKEFDARALSTFGISADKTVNAMCSDVMNACTALMGATGDADWRAGISGIATSTTYETMMQTCRQVGRACIIQVCTSASGNFGLCESISNSVNRRSILNNTVCWDQVKDCISSVGEENINNIFAQLDMSDTTMSTLNFYSRMYPATTDNNDQSPTTHCSEDSTNCVYDLCTKECFGQNPDIHDCRVCRLAENIWGNCEMSPTTWLATTDSHNKIKKPADEISSTLLYWFAVNTGTNNESDSCRDTVCGVGKVPTYDADGALTCMNNSEACFVNDNSNNLQACTYKKIDIASSDDNNPRCNCCPTNVYDSAGNCCASGYTVSDIEDTYNGGYGTLKYCVQHNKSIVITQPFIIARYSTGSTSTDIYAVYICDGNDTLQEFEDGIQCSNGTILGVTLKKQSNNTFVPVHYWSPTDENFVREQYIDTQSDLSAQFCMRQSSTTTSSCYTKPVTNTDCTWRTTSSENSRSCNTGNPQNWTIVFNEL